MLVHTTGEHENKNLKHLQILNSFHLKDALEIRGSKTRSNC